MLEEAKHLTWRTEDGGDQRVELGKAPQERDEGAELRMQIATAPGSLSMAITRRANKKLGGIGGFSSHYNADATIIG